MNTTNHTSPSGEDAATVAIPRYIVIGYGETDHPQAAFVNEREQLLDAVLGMMYTSPSNADAEIREAYRKDLAEDDEWSNEGIWSAEFEIGGITIYDLGEHPVHQCANGKSIGEDAANGAIGEREAFEEAFRRNFEFPEHADQFTFRKGWEAGIMQARAALTASLPPVADDPADDGADKTPDAQ